MLRDHLHCFHVDLIDIGTFFTVDFNTDKVLVHEAGDVLILERFVFHDMTPVAGGVANTDKKRFVLSLCLFKGLLTPGIPVDRVIGVLLQIEAFFVYQVVGHGCRWVTSYWKLLGIGTL
jgi:hypothetical protein